MKAAIRRIFKTAVLAALAAAAVCPVFQKQRITEAAWADRSEIRLPIIMYHSVVEKPSRWGKYAISPRELEDDLTYLRENGYTTVSVSDLTDHVYGGKPLPDKPIMLTFDDGYYNNYLYAYPLLRKYQMKAVMSVIGEYMDSITLNAHDNPHRSYITWEQAVEMANSGYVEIQNHSYNLHRINAERTASMRAKGESIEHYETVLLSDTIRLQALIDNYTMHLPEAFAYPYGLISKDSIGILKEAGFKSTLTCYSGINTITEEPDCLYMLKRNLRPHGKTIASILEKYR